MWIEDNREILVCDGDEFKAIKKGFSNHQIAENIFVLPIGINAVNKLLKQTMTNHQKALLIGLGGSLSRKYQVGDVVIYESCSYLEQGKMITKNCDRILNNLLQSKLNASLVQGLTTDKLVASPSEKELLNQQFNCTVVDMETYAVMNYFESVSVIRVISDNVDDFLPNLNSAITPDGKLDKLKMTIAFLKEPLKAVKLIQNALISLKKLEQISRQLIINNFNK
jgi:nucleoside phosphorylase